MDKILIAELSLQLDVLKNTKQGYENIIEGIKKDLENSITTNDGIFDSSYYLKEAEEKIKKLKLLKANEDKRLKKIFELFRSFINNSKQQLTKLSM